MNRPRLIETLLACGRDVPPVPGDVRERIFAWALATAAAPPTEQGVERECRAYNRRHLLRRGAGVIRRRRTAARIGLPVSTFVRVHRRALVNLQRVARLAPNQGDGFVAEGRGGRSAEVTRQVARELRRRLGLR